ECHFRKAEKGLLRQVTRLRDSIFCSLIRQSDGEAAAFPFAALKAHRPSQGFDKTFDDCQSQPGTRDGFRVGSTVKQFKEISLVFLRDSDAIIGHRDLE